MTVADVYIVGAPKAGTTSLAAWLDQHHDVYFCSPKEPGFWADDYPKVRELRGFETREKYERAYAGEEARAAAHHGDGSTTYLYSEVAVPAILAEVGAAARFVVALRDPAQLVPSFHRMQQLRLNEDEPDVEKAWRRCLAGGLPATDLLDPKLVDYVRVGRMGAAVARLLDVVPRAQVHFVRFDDLRDATEQTWRDLAAFVGLDPEPLPDFEVQNPGTRMFRSRTLHRLLQRPPKVLAVPMRRLRHWSMRSTLFADLKHRMWWRQAPRPSVSAEFRAELTAFFASDVALLAELTGLDLSGWSDPGRPVSGDSLDAG